MTGAAFARLRADDGSITGGGRGKTVTQQQCQELFDTYNQQYFGGRLPPYRIVSSILNDDSTCRLDGECRKETLEIHLRTALQDSDVPIVLLHEMAHAASRSGHGKQWLAEMLRLAELGAPTRDDWNAYQGPTIGIREFMADAYDAGAETETDVPWSVVRYEIGRRYGLTDDRGRSVSTPACKALRRCWKEFWKGRRDSLSSGS